jgi:hypothetical protein
MDIDQPGEYKFCYLDLICNSGWSEIFFSKEAVKENEVSVETESDVGLSIAVTEKVRGARELVRN